MTAENDGTGATPEGDDPFGYLYRQEGGEGSPAPQSGTPRRSYNHVRAVGERQYGGYGNQYGGGAGTQQTAAYGHQPNAHYAAPETMPGGRAAAQQPPGGHGGGRGQSGPGGRSRNGLLIGALSVVAAVVIGIGAAIYFNSGDEEGGPDAGAVAGADEGGKGQEEKDSGPDKPRKGKPVGEKLDASGFQLAGGATAAGDIPGAASKDGSYVGSMNVTGASATWSADVPKAGSYTLFVRYGVPGKDANATLSVNGRPRSQPLNMSNFGKAKEGDWAKGWTRTYAYVSLKQGSNTFKISCEQGNKCDFNLDQVWLKSGKVR